MDLEHFNNFLNDMYDLDAFDDWIQIKHTMPPPPRTPPNPTAGLRRRRFNPLLDLKEQQFRAKYRYTKDNMRRIIELLRDEDLEADRDNQVPFELQIMAAIRFWARTEHPEVTASVHSVTARTLAKICRRVASALAAKASRYIRMPATLSEKQGVINAFQALADMPQVIGAVAHSSVRFRNVTNAADAEEEFGSQSQNNQIHIQIVSDAAHKIRDLDCRLLRRSMGQQQQHSDYAHKMFTQTRIKERFEQNEFRGRILLADYHYACTSFLFTSVSEARTPAEHAFNRAHATTFAPAVHCLNAWTQRFGILQSEICSASFGTARQTIVALALLHNMAIEWNDPSLACNLNGFSAACYAGCSYSSVGSPSSSAAAASENSDDTNARLEFIKHNF